MRRNSFRTHASRIEPLCIVYNINAEIYASCLVVLFRFKSVYFIYVYRFVFFLSFLLCSFGRAAKKAAVAMNSFLRLLAFSSFFPCLVVQNLELNVLRYPSKAFPVTHPSHHRTHKHLNRSHIRRL